MRPFRELTVWQRSHQLVLDIYRSTDPFPSREQFGLQGQIRRAAASIPANIAEGSARSTPAEFAHSLNIALGSAAELEYHLLLAHELGYLRVETYAALDDTLSEVKRMLVALRKHVNAQRRANS